MNVLPPGVRFYPTEEELISFYLHNKLQGKGPHQLDQVIPVVDIYDHNPWALKQCAGTYCRDDPEQCFFFVPMQENQARGARPNRLTKEGYWKATGSPGHVYSSDNRIIGMKRTMVFYQGRAPNGKKTEWKMNEYKAIDGEPSSSSTTATPKWRQELCLCRIYIKSKCARSFDRRPPAVDQVVKAARRQPSHVNNNETTIIQQDHHPPAAVLENGSSLLQAAAAESSSSGDYSNNTSNNDLGSINWDVFLGDPDNMAFDDEPWWDLQHENFD